ncbi:hypothetical protein PSHT_12584 [Puccinia striiformis]|uniref:ATP-dependent DNA helicase n=1 Tax=Puccinia striiformis TaxID=27350 RepID=A0A2S4UVQ2_9BASI|nr:hypothetical protein PSHT_12584 [Puccinia striiformis]
MYPSAAFYRDRNFSTVTRSTHPSSVMPRQRSNLAEQTVNNQIPSKRTDEVFDKLIEDVYGDLRGDWSLTSGRIFERFTERAIFTQSPETTQSINKIIFERAGGETYTSRAEDVNYSAGWTIGEFEGTTQIPLDMAPAREMNLKVGMPVLLTEHSFMKGGLVSGTRLVITGIYDGFLKAQITGGRFKGDEIVIAKVWFFVTHADSSSPHFLRFQYPIVQAYAITFHFNLYDPYRISGVFLDRRVFQEFVRSLRPVDMVLCDKMYIVSLSQSVLMVKD